MADILCGYTADRDETLVAYLYGDIEASQRVAFDAHIATCERCRHELEDLQQVRGQLQFWTAPEVSPSLVAAAPLLVGPTSRADTWAGLRGVPAWARLAAAAVILSVSAGVGGAIANLDVRYDRGALTLRTGWSRSSSREAPTTSANQPGMAAGGIVPWKGDLEALERRLRTDLRGTDARATAPAASTTLPGHTEGAAANPDAQLLRRVRTLVEDSERRQRNELALRIAEVVQEFNTKRGTDLANIRSMKTIQSATGLEVVRQQQWLNLLTQASVQSR